MGPLDFVFIESIKILQIDCSKNVIQILKERKKCYPQPDKLIKHICLLGYRHLKSVVF